MPTTGFIKPGRINMIVDGQFGSTGKGAIAARVALDNHIDIAVGTLSPNAGHTFYIDDRKYVVKQLPVAGVLQKRSTIFLSAGSVIDPEALLKEMEYYEVEPERVFIHPRAAIITEADKKQEQSIGGIETIGSTQSGTGAARATKIMRTNSLAMGCRCAQITHMVHDIDLDTLCGNGANVLVETGQGLGLGLNFGHAYPFCTSRDVIPAQVLADCGVHPRRMGNTMMSLRTFPIRVGNPMRNGTEVGYSGPFYPDSQELTWDLLGQREEYTTVTGRVRRVATFSIRQYADALRLIKPTHIFLNFINYVREEDLKIFSFRGLAKPTHVGYGPYVHQICPYDKDIIVNAFYSTRYTGA